MALRVLLADESSSIKKVMQLALQDFAVEVKVVPIGLDVITVAKNWPPDIFFVDVLLAKRSGYDVCADIKNDPVLCNTPVVLMWSGFMDLDEQKAKHSQADRRLEKPFDADTLRGIVKDLVPQTQTNEISDFLSFPHLPDFVEKKGAKPTGKAATPPPPPPKMTVAPIAATADDENTPEPTFNAKPSPLEEDAAPLILNPDIIDHINHEMDGDEPETFVQAPLPSLSPRSQNVSPSSSNQNAEPWSAGNLDRFKINLPQEETTMPESNMMDLMDAPIMVAGQGEIQLGELEEIPTSPKTTTMNLYNPTTEGISPNLIDPAMVEHILREQVRQVLHDIAWKIIPDIAERVINEEIKKLLKDAEKLS